MYRESPTKASPRVSLSPTSYNHLDSYKKSQLPAPNFYISKYKFTGFIGKESGAKKYIPGSGTYEHDKHRAVMTKGLGKGWK